MVGGDDAGDPRGRSVRWFVADACAGMRIADGVRRKRRERLRRAEADLLRCVEVRGEPLLADDERELLALEREFDPAGAIGRVAAPEVLLEVLASFLTEPEWQGEDDEDRRVRMRLVADLAGAVVRLPRLAGADLACSLRELRAAQRSARRRLQQDQLERRLARMDPELRARIEAEMAAPARRSVEGDLRR